jgi:hypothetical protein
MIGKLLKLAIIVLIVLAIMRSPNTAAHNVRVAGTAAIHVLSTVAESAGKFINALVTHK